MNYLEDATSFTIDPLFTGTPSPGITRRFKFAVTAHHRNEEMNASVETICLVSDEEMGRKIVSLLTKGTSPSWFIVKQDPSGPAKADGPFFVVDSGVESVMKPKGIVCEVGDRAMADSIRELMNQAENGNQAPQCAGNDNDSNYSAEDYRLSYTQKWTKEYTGTILTLLDASIPNVEQNAALKKLVKKAARELLSLQWKVFVDPIYERMNETISSEIDLS